MKHEPEAIAGPSNSVIARPATGLHRWLTLLALILLCAGFARAQSFPFNDAFASYPPGSTGAPAWSMLGGAFNAADGVLHAPITLRYNGRPPALYTVEATMRVGKAAPDENGLLASAGFAFNMQHDADTGSSDNVALVFRSTAEGEQASVERGTQTPSGTRTLATPLPDPGHESVPIRLVVDAGNGRYAFFVAGTAVLTSQAAEYAAGLLAVRLQGAATLDDVVLRAPTEAETAAVRVTTLFNDPRDIAAGDDGEILVLNRSDPAVLAVTTDGEVTRRFARRVPGRLADPVALARGKRGEVLILNRFPAQVVAYDRNGGFRYRFGETVLKEPVAIAVRSTGAVYVADPAAKKVFAFDASGRPLGAMTAFGDRPGTPTDVAIDGLDNLVVFLDHGARTVTLRPAADDVTAALVREEEGGPTSVAVTPGGQTLALWQGKITEWPRAARNGPSFSGAAVGGLDPEGRLARVGDHMALLERSLARIIFVPLDLRDTRPSVTMQNISDTAAIVRWTSDEPSDTSRVRLLRGSTWDTVTAHATKPDTKHQVLVERLKPGTEYKYELSPTVRTVPPSDWSAVFTFTAGQSTPEPAKGEAP